MACCPQSKLAIRHFTIQYFPLEFCSLFNRQNHLPSPLRGLDRGTSISIVDVMKLE